MTIFGELVSLPSYRPRIFNLLQTIPSRTGPTGIWKNVDTNMRTKTWKLLAVMKKMDKVMEKKGSFGKLSAVRKSACDSIGICLCGTYTVHI
jgi:hypothetical protein